MGESQWVSEWMNERVNEWMNEWVNEWSTRMNEWMNEWMNEIIIQFTNWEQNLPAVSSITFKLSTLSKLMENDINGRRIGINLAFLGNNQRRIYNMRIFNRKLLIAVISNLKGNITHISIGCRRIPRWSRDRQWRPNLLRSENVVVVIHTGNTMTCVVVRDVDKLLGNENVSDSHPFVSDYEWYK